MSVIGGETLHPHFSRFVFFMIDRWRLHRSSSLQSSGWWRAELPQSVALRPSQTLCVFRGVEGDACGRVMHVWSCQGMGGYFDWFLSRELCFCFLWKQVENTSQSSSVFQRTCIAAVTNAKERNFNLFICHYTSTMNYINGPLQC